MTDERKEEFTELPDLSPDDDLWMEEPPDDLDLVDQLEDLDEEYTDFMDALYNVGGVWDCTHVDLLNIPITIHSFVEVTTKYGKALVAKVEDDGAIMYALLGGEVLVKQLTRVAKYLPLKATIIKTKRYYEFGKVK